MKKIGILSDTHGYWDDRYATHFAGCDEIWHAGDIGTDGVRVAMTHIGGYPGKYAPGVKFKLEVKRPQIFVDGHSHILKVIYDRQLGLLHINPGAAGVYGWQAVRTLIRLYVDCGTIKDLEVIELAKPTKLK